MTLAVALQPAQALAASHASPVQVTPLSLPWRSQDAGMPAHDGLQAPQDLRALLCVKHLAVLRLDHYLFRWFRLDSTTEAWA